MIELSCKCMYMETSPCSFTEHFTLLIWALKKPKLALLATQIFTYSIEYFTSIHVQNKIIHMSNNMNVKANQNTLILLKIKWHMCMSHLPK